MASFLLIDDGSPSVHAATSDFLVQQQSVIVPHHRGEQLPISQFNAIVVPISSVGSEIWSRRRTRIRICYGEVAAMERAIFLGATDYLCEPWSPEELLLRVRRGFVAETESYGNVIEVDGVTVVVSEIQASIWRELRRWEGNVVDRRTLADRVGIPYQSTGSEESRAVDMQIARLRRSLGNAGGRIETVRGRGYRLLPENAKNSNMIVDK
ncbi:MAG: winged helix-turn-helix domain-containing protein [Alkalispirochaeta sp.]